MISVPFQGKAFNMIANQVYTPTASAKEAEAEQFNEDLQDFLDLTPKKKKKMFFLSQGTGMQKQEVKKHIEKQARLALEYKMKQGKS